MTRTFFVGLLAAAATVAPTEAAWRILGPDGSPDRHPLCQKCR